ncbi:MAG: peptidylprolyl isomerase [Chloroflexi bacterium]|nr:peptidylprolyl isomerase [Chloroflexota bacterium]MDA1239753.1 peptidylprolyl isomerase [Chloroflexota bacterium]MQC47676.1 peptidylprolyl isomerase [Chloroflexota bacterium]
MAQQYDAPPPITTDPDKKYTAVVTTPHGEFKISLLTDVAPITVNNFVFLAREGFYDGTTFHRVIPGFVAQGGDPTGTGRGGPGYRFQDELSDTPFVEGIVGMANAGPHTNGSQFYLMIGDASHLTGRYTAFGRVEEGMDVVHQIRTRDPERDQSPGDAMIKVEIVEE